MPRHSRNAGIGPPSGGNGIDAFTTFGMEDLQPISTAAGLIAGATDEAAIKTPADATDCAAVITRHCTPADPVRSVPEGYEGVAAANGEVATCRREGKRETGGRVGL